MGISPPRKRLKGLSDPSTCSDSGWAPGAEYFGMTWASPGPHVLCGDLCQTSSLRYLSGEGTQCVGLSTQDVHLPCEQSGGLVFVHGVRHRLCTQCQNIAVLGDSTHQRILPVALKVVVRSWPVVLCGTQFRKESTTTTQNKTSKQPQNHKIADSF